MTNRIHASQRESGGIQVFYSWAICDEQGGAGIFQLITDFAFAIAGIQEGGDSSRQSGSVIGGTELPAVGQEDGDSFAGLHFGGDESARQLFEDIAVFGVGDAAIAGGIEERGFFREPTATFEYQVVYKLALG